MTDRDRLRMAIEISDIGWEPSRIMEETRGAIIVPGVRKYSFETTGVLRDIFNWEGGAWVRVKRVSE